MADPQPDRRADSSQSMAMKLKGLDMADPVPYYGDLRNEGHARGRLQTSCHTVHNKSYRGIEFPCFMSLVFLSCFL